MIPLMLAQFLSALADNALLFGALALLKQQAFPDWAAPALQSCMIVAYVLLAPFAGAIADRHAKRNVMVGANLLKMLGALGLLCGVNPFVCYGLVGVGAALYSPAKYGILAEILPAEKLVRGNGLLESSTIVAILAGAVLGGLLADASLLGLLVSCVAVYAVAAGCSRLVQYTRSPTSVTLKQAWGQFWRDGRTLWRDRASRLSLLATAVFWGSGATLRLLLVAWVPVALLITDNKTPAMLSALVAIGIAVGAGIAAKAVTLDRAERVLPAGLLLGLVVMVFSQAGNLWVAGALLVLIGLLGGLYVVPLNALLQARAHELTGAGQAIAVQNLFENIAMLAMMGLYASASAVQMGPTGTAAGFGALLAVLMGLLMTLRTSGPAALTPKTS